MSTYPNMQPLLATSEALAEALAGVAEVVDLSAEEAPIPPGCIRTKDGKIIPRERAVFLLRDHVENGELYKVASDRAYASGPGGQLRRLGTDKLTKAEKTWIRQAKKNSPGVDIERLFKRAKKKGWTTPVNDVFSALSWVAYWMACEEAERNPETGRPVAPHRSGAQMVEGKP